MRLSPVNNGSFAIFSNGKDGDWEKVQAVAEKFFADGYDGAEECEGEFISICHHEYHQAAKDHKELYKIFKTEVAKGI